MEFRAKIEIDGINPYVLLGKRRARALKAGWRKPLPVLVQVNGKPDTPWRINAMPKGDGSFYLYLHGDVRKASRTKVGDRVTVRVRFDEAYRGGPAALPTWLRTPLKNVKAEWDALTPSRQKEIVRYLLALKSDEARQRNLTRVVAKLAGEKGRWMGRKWEDGR